MKQNTKWFIIDVCVVSGIILFAFSIWAYISTIIN